MGVFAVTSMLALTSVVVCTALEAAAQDKPKLYVYLHTSTKPHALQNKLSRKMPEVEVTVFGRIKDLEKNIKETPPDAVLALRPVLDAISLKATMQGMDHQSQDTEVYVIMSAQGTVTPDQLQEKVVGTIDLLGRKRTSKFISVMLQSPGKIKLRRVKKNEDLLPLLQLESADVILLPERIVPEIKSRSELRLEISKIPGARAGLPAVAVLNNAGPIESSLKGLDGSTLQLLGLSKWSH